MAKVTGVVVIQWDGTSLRTKEGATLSIGGKNREPEYASGQLIGFVEAPVGSTVSATLSHTAASDLRGLANGDSVTLIFQCDSGPQYVIRNAFLTEPPELAANGGGVTVNWTGQPADET